MIKAACLASTLIFTLATAAWAEGDPDAGAKVFRKCKACHKVGADAANGVGPQLNGVVDRAAGSVDGFTYSDALSTAAGDGLVWTAEELDAFITKPKTFMPGTKMAFPGISNEDQRADVISYLGTFE